MPKYEVFGSKEVTYRTVVEAPTGDEAYDVAEGLKEDMWEFGNESLIEPYSIDELEAE